MQQCKKRNVVKFLIKPTTAQLHLYTLRHVSTVTIRPSSGRMFFLLDKEAYGTLVLMNMSLKMAE
jgi:hypothetical protein